MEHRWQYEARDSGESRGELEGLIDDEEEEWEIARHYHIQVLIEGADVLPITVPIQTIDRPRERVEEVGLQTAEEKSILRKLQQIVAKIARRLPGFCGTGMSVACRRHTVESHRRGGWGARRRPRRGAAAVTGAQEAFSGAGGIRDLHRQ
jgi:hypothetical protein